MLAGILKNEIAIQVSINIMRAFASMLFAYIQALFASPATGDESKPWLWAVIAGVALVLVVVLLILGKKGGDGGEGK